MKAQHKFLATAAVVVSILLVFRVAPGAAILLALGLLAALYTAWRRMHQP